MSETEGATSEVEVAETADAELEPKPPVTAAQLIQELREKFYRNPLHTSTIGMDNPEDPGRLELQVRDDVISPIMLARYVNVKPQMVYQAIRDGKLTAVKWNNTQKKYVRLEEAMKWAAKYLTRKQVRDLEAAREAAYTHAAEEANAS